MSIKKHYSAPHAYALHAVVVAGAASSSPALAAEAEPSSDQSWVSSSEFCLRKCSFVTYLICLLVLLCAMRCRFEPSRLPQCAHGVRPRVL